MKKLAVPFSNLFCFFSLLNNKGTGKTCDFAHDETATCLPDDDANDQCIDSSSTDPDTAQDTVQSDWSRQLTDCSAANKTMDIALSGFGMDCSSNVNAISVKVGAVEVDCAIKCATSSDRGLTCAIDPKLLWGSGLPVASTTLQSSLEAGATQIPMIGAVALGFKIGQRVVVGSGANQEERIIVGFGSLLLDRPLKNSHAKDEPIVALDSTAGNKEGHVVKIVRSSDGATSLSSITAPTAMPKIYFGKPSVSAFRSVDVEHLWRTSGGSNILVTGNNFGPLETAIQVWLVSSEQTFGANSIFFPAGLILPATSVEWMSNTRLSFRSPALTGAGAGTGWSIRVLAGGQQSKSWASGDPTFSYDLPIVEEVVPINTTPADGETGIPMTVKGKNFADVDTNHIRIFAQRDGVADVECTSIVRVSSTELTCMYPDAGQSGCPAANVVRTVSVTVAGQTSSAGKRLCYKNVQLTKLLSDDAATGIPSAQAITEGGSISYSIKLDAAAINSFKSSSTGTTVSVVVASNNPKCVVSKSSLTFTQADFQVDYQITVTAKDDAAFSTKDLAAFKCEITHAAVLNVPDRRRLVNQDLPKAHSVTLSLTARSGGCGEGEYFGAFPPRSDPFQCICDRSYYFSKFAGCTKCPERSSICDEQGLSFPIVKEGFWRYSPSNPNITEDDAFYQCPVASWCIGGNSSDGRCVKGHDDDGPVCATCEDGYVMTDGVGCQPCPGFKRSMSNMVRGEMTSLLVIGMVLLIVGFVFHLSKSAISKQRRIEVNDTLFEALESGKLDDVLMVEVRSMFNKKRLAAEESKDDNNNETEREQVREPEPEPEPKPEPEQNTELDIATFLRVLSDAEIHLTVAEADMIFNEIDSEVSDGFLSGTELMLYFESQQMQLFRLSALANQLYEEYQAAQDNKAEIDAQRETNELDDVVTENDVTAVDVVIAIDDDLAHKAIDGLKTVSSVAVPVPPVPRVKSPEALKDVGSVLMKIKLVMGFLQCVSFIPATFGSVPWPKNFIDISTLLSIASVDLFSLLGNVCEFSTGFYTKFLFQMAIVPSFFLAAVFGLGVTIVVVPRCCPNRWSKVSKESIGTKLFEVCFLVAYTLYTSVSTTIFTLFKCEKIQGKWYLAADYSVVCLDAQYNQYVILALVCMMLFTVGIPLGVYILLFRSRKVLYPEHCVNTEDEDQSGLGRTFLKHAGANRRLSSVYEAYSPNAYYFDLVDLVRRLMLTGGLVLLGEQSNVQIFLGGLLCIMWLCLVLVMRPYDAYWDNILSGTLSLQLLLIIFSGMGLEIYRLTPSYMQDPYQAAAMGAFLVAASVVVIISGVLVVFISLPCLRDPLVDRCCRSSDDDDDEEEEEEEEEETTKEIAKKENNEEVDYEKQEQEVQDNEKGVSMAAMEIEMVAINVPVEAKKEEEKCEESNETTLDQKTISITIPKGTKAGNKIHVNLPDGRKIHVTVPKGMHAGNTMTINYTDHAHHVK